MGLVDSHQYDPDGCTFAFFRSRVSKPSKKQPSASQNAKTMVFDIRKSIEGACAERPLCQANLIQVKAAGRLVY